mgnify:CR=1 FL=1
MANPSESQSAPLLNPNQRQAAKWKYKIEPQCARVLAERLLEDMPKEGWELVSINSYVDVRLTADELSDGRGCLQLGYTLVFRRDETRLLDVVADENVHQLKRPEDTHD